MSDSHNHLTRLTQEWNRVPNWTVLEAWKEGNNFYHKIRKDGGKVFVYCATRAQDKNGHIFRLSEITSSKEAN